MDILRAPSRATLDSATRTENRLVELAEKIDYLTELLERFLTTR